MQSPTDPADRTGTIGVEAFDAAYGAGFQASDDSPHAVECELVEDGGAFVAHRPTDADRPRRVAFVDGTLRTEARLTRTGPDGDLAPSPRRARSRSRATAERRSARIIDEQAAGGERRALVLLDGDATALLDPPTIHLNTAAFHLGLLNSPASLGQQPLEALSYQLLAFFYKVLKPLHPPKLAVGRYQVHREIFRTLV